MTMANHTMDISGFDTVIFSWGIPAQLIRTLVERIQVDWHELIVDVHLLDTNQVHRDLVSKDGCVAAVGLERHVAVYCYRSTQMRTDHEERGYALNADGEGPFAVHFRKRTGIVFELGSINERSCRETSIGTVDPYPGWLCSSELLELSVVTPLNPEFDPFSQWVVNQVISTCT